VLFLCLALVSADLVSVMVVPRERPCGETLWRVVKQVYCRQDVIEPAVGCSQSS